MFSVIKYASPRLSTQRKCEIAGIARSSYYRSLKSSIINNQDEIKLRDQIQDICLTMPRYGYRRVTAELRRRSYSVNHKCVLRLMREDNLLCLRKKHWIRTTDSAHGYRIYTNLVQGITLTHLNQLWVADITYVRLIREFVYVAIILDAFSRRVIGWALSRHLNAQLSISALNMALGTRTVMPGLIHHSDQGVQYAATQYTDLLKAHSISVSMSRRGNPYDNAMAESFMKTLKYEEVHLNEYETFDHAYENIGHFIDDLYNLKRLHSSLDYKPPIEFENDFLNSHIHNNCFTLTLDSNVSI
jgi:putative transposase